MDSVLKNQITEPSGPEIYGVFYTYGEDEGNIVCELLGISTNVEDAKVLISKKLSVMNITKIHCFNDNMNKGNNYTHIGCRSDIKVTRGFGQFTGFIIEKLKINELT